MFTVHRPGVMKNDPLVWGRWYLLGAIKRLPSFLCVKNLIDVPVYMIAIFRTVIRNLNIVNVKTLS